MINPINKKQKQIINFFIDNEEYLKREKYKNFLSENMFDDSEVSDLLIESLLDKNPENIILLSMFDNSISKKEVFLYFNKNKNKKNIYFLLIYLIRIKDAKNCNKIVDLIESKQLKKLVKTLISQ